MDPDNHALTAFVNTRPRLFGIAYRMLGSAAEADDLVQDVWLRWQITDRTAVQDPPAFLATITTRLAINVAQSARVRRETYIGPWLPEPVDTRSDPTLGADRGEALEMATLLLLEKLTPSERAAFVLREAFEYPYAQIAGILQLTETNIRQLVARARKHLARERRAPVAPSEHRRLLEVFIGAAQTGDQAALEALLASDVVSYSDGGGVVRAARIPVAGRERVAKFIAAFASRFWTGGAIAWVEANGQPTVLHSRDRAIVAIINIDASPDGIHQIFWVMNPAKTAAWLTPLPPPV